MWQLYLLFSIYVSIIAGIGAAIGWHVNLVTLIVLTGIYIGILLRTDWLQSLGRDDRNALDWLDAGIPLIPVAAAWFAAAFARGWLDMARHPSVPSTLRDWFLR